jgi:putative transposase
MDDALPPDEIELVPHPHPGHLPRLAGAAYRGKAILHWTLTVRDRATGWLTNSFTRRFRWIILHGCARYSVSCPVYCLMPDHIHLLVHGWSAQGDQRTFMRFLRQHTNTILTETAHRWQPQAHDHVLRADERDNHSFEQLVHYITHNPVRAGLVTTPQAWPHTGTVIPGYPELTLWNPDFWDRYWRLRKVREAM